MKRRAVDDPAAARARREGRVIASNGPAAPPPGNNNSNHSFLSFLSEVASSQGSSAASSSSAAGESGGSVVAAVAAADAAQAPPQQQQQDQRSLAASDTAVVGVSTDGSSEGDEEEQGSSSSSGGLSYPHPKNFAERLMNVLESGIASECIWWVEEIQAVALQQKKLKKGTVLQTHFSGNKYSAFLRNFNRWGFRRVPYHGAPDGSVIYKNCLFRKDKPHLVKHMRMDSDVQDVFARHQLTDGGNSSATRRGGAPALPYGLPPAVAALIAKGSQANQSNSGTQGQQASQQQLQSQQQQQQQKQQQPQQQQPQPSQAQALQQMLTSLQQQQQQQQPGSTPGSPRPQMNNNNLAAMLQNFQVTLNNGNTQGPNSGYGLMGQFQQLQQQQQQQQGQQQQHGPVTPAPAPSSSSLHAMSIASSGQATTNSMMTNYQYGGGGGQKQPQPQMSGASAPAPAAGFGGEQAGFQQQLQTNVAAEAIRGALAGTGGGGEDPQRADAITSTLSMLLQQLQGGQAQTQPPPEPYRDVVLRKMLEMAQEYMQQDPSPTPQGSAVRTSVELLLMLGRQELQNNQNST